MSDNTATPYQVGTEACDLAAQILATTRAELESEMVGLLGSVYPDWYDRGARAVITDVVLFRSIWANACLTHRLRTLVTFRYGACDIRSYRFIALCGFIARGTRFDYYGDDNTGGPGYVSVDPNDETFICHLCHAIAQRHGIDTFALIPDTGCSATGGAMYRPRSMAVSP